MLSIAFIMAFVVAAVSMIIGIFIYSEVSSGIEQTFEPLLITETDSTEYTRLVPIVHAYDESFETKDGGVGEQPYRQIPDISLTSGNFTAGNQYLIIFKSEMSQHSGFSDFPNLFTRSLHGDTEFIGSEMSLELQQGATSAGHTYNYFTVWTAVEGEDLTMQFKSDSSRAVSARHTSISAIELEEFIEGEDYFFETRVASDSLSTTFTATNPSITLTTNGSDDWWVFGNSGFSDIGDFIQAESRINLDDTTLTPHHIQQGEDQITDKQLFYLTRVYTPSAGSHTFEIESRVHTGTVGIREYSSIFAINLDKFGVHEIFYLSDIQSIGNTGAAYETEAGTVTIDPTQATDVFAQSFVQSDTISGSCCSYMRQQVADVSPTGNVENATKDRHWGGLDIISWAASIIINLDSATKIDLDVGAFGQSGCCGPTSNVHDISIVAFTMSAKVLEYEDQTPEAFSRADSIAFTILAIIPITLFFGLFTILSPRIDGEI